MAGSQFILTTFINFASPNLTQPPLTKHQFVNSSSNGSYLMVTGCILEGLTLSFIWILHMVTS